MSDVYISYKREDRDRVQALAMALQGAGFGVWWDRNLEGGANWRARMEEELAAARCVVVVWSTLSVGSAGEFVHDEAQRAAERGVLLPVRIDDVRPPLGFGGRQALDLTGWSGDLLDARYLGVRAAVDALVQGGPARSAQARQVRLRTLAFGATALAFASSALGFFANVASIQEPACRLSVVKTCLCRPLGLGGVPTAAEDETWRGATAGTDGAGLRSYLRQYPSGAYAAEAQTRLAGCRTGDAEAWTPDVRHQPLILPAAPLPLASEAAARADALTRGKTEAGFICSGYAQGEFRLTASEPNAHAWTCAPRAGGYACGFDGEAICKVEVRRMDRTEVCKGA